LSSARTVTLSRPAARSSTSMAPVTFSAVKPASVRGTSTMRPEPVTRSPVKPARCMKAQSSACAG
jgi:hypothetical protein